MSWTTVDVFVAISIRRRQLRAVLSPLGVQASPPESHSEFGRHPTLNTRSSPVSRSTDDPGCTAAGGAVHERIGIDVDVTLTGLTPGTPLTVSKVIALVLACIGMNRSDVLASDCAGCGVNHDVDGPKRDMRAPAQPIRSGLLST